MKGILFKEEMFKAVIEGQKTQTRRIVQDIKFKGERVNLALCGSLIGKGITEYTNFELSDGRIFGLYPRYRTGEVVYLKEPYIAWNHGPITYKFQYFPGTKDHPWKNKLFMPEKYARYFIKITNVRCERLQDITEQDAIAEGITKSELNSNNDCNGYKAYWNYLTKCFQEGAINSYKTLWDSINVKWNRKHDDYRGLMFEDNPYVWVYKFELTQMPI
jgi:hypothetical protein